MKHNLSILLPSFSMLLAGVSATLFSNAGFSNNINQLERLNLNSGAEIYSSLAPIGVIAVIALVVAVILIGLWSLFSIDSKPSIITRLFGFSLSANDLFLSLNFKTKTGEEKSGHLRSINMKEATLLSPLLLGKGETILLNLGSLPDFPSETAFVKSTVSSIRAIGGKPEFYIVSLKLSDPKLQPLEQYLQTLTSPLS